jgi:hypothetical protein
MDHWNDPHVRLLRYPAPTGLATRAGRALLARPVDVEEWIRGTHIMSSDLTEENEALARQMRPGWIYYAVWSSPTVYPRPASGGRVVIDVMTPAGDYLTYDDKYREAYRLGLSTVPLIYSGTLVSVQSPSALCKRTSFLGGPAQGVIIKEADPARPLRNIAGQPILVRV